MFSWRDDRETVLLALTDRRGGVSQGPYAGLNLGAHVGDDPAAVGENRRLVAEAIGVEAGRLVFMDQCHGAEVAVVDTPPTRPPAVDALVTTSPGLGLVALVADCVPVLLADEDAGIVAAAHAGRPGMVAGVVPATIAAMRDLGARSITAIVGPSVCGRCYEVPAEMRTLAADLRPESLTVSWTGTPAIDVAAGVVAQLGEAGVPVTWVPGCAREREDLFSHRRDGVTGRFAGVVVLTTGD